MPAEVQRFEFDIKRSRFVSLVAPVTDKVHAASVLNTQRQRYADANHHCWAMVAGAPDDVFQQDQSDDGEPKGTAGKPMLNALLHSGLGHTLVVTTRYFGGVKLGAGGLVRAYTRSVTDALKQLKTVEHLVTRPVHITLPYAAWDSFQHWLQSTPIRISHQQFTDHVLAELAVPDDHLDALKARLGNLSGRILSSDSI